MTDIQLSIFIKGQIARLKNLRDQILAELPEDLAKTRTVKSSPFAIKFSPNTPDSWEVTEYPILFGLDNYISELEADAERLRIPADKREKV